MEAMYGIPYIVYYVGGVVKAGRRPLTLTLPPWVHGGRGPEWDWYPRLTSWAKFFRLFEAGRGSELEL